MKMNQEEWLCSKIKLCHVNTGPNAGSSNVWDQSDIVLNNQSYLQPLYDPSSIFLTLEAYCDALYELKSRESEVSMSYQNQYVSGFYLGQTDVLEQFAKMLAGDILAAAVRKTGSQDEGTDKCMMEPPEVMTWRLSNNERLAEKLASEIYKNALEELTRLGAFPEGKCEKVLNVQLDKNNVQNEPGSFCCSSLYHCDEREGQGIEEFDSTDNLHRSLHDLHTRVCHSGSTADPNTLDGMAQMGSIDYPDAPPSTPLLPEMIKSRASFTRKLKGGLAKEFLPSPPPPTPSDRQASTDKSEFMARLLRSLSLACSQQDDATGEVSFQSRISDYAAQLSTDIIQCITGTQPSSTNRETPVKEVHFLAEDMAEEIITASVAEVIGCRRAYTNANPDKDIQSYFEASTDNTTQALSNTSSPSPSSQEIPAVEAVSALAGQLIANALVQAYSGLRNGKLQSFNSCTSNTDSQHWFNGKAENNNTMLDSTMKSMAELSFIESIVHKVLKSSLKEASMTLIRCNQSIHSNGFNSSQRTVLRGVISDTLRIDIQELQCVVLWAAASQMGISVLQMNLADTHIPQKLCSLSQQALVNDWTVSDLVTFLLQYCADLQIANRGHYKISDSLLEKLLLCMTKD